MIHSPNIKQTKMWYNLMELVELKGIYLTFMLEHTRSNSPWVVIMNQEDQQSSNTVWSHTGLRHR